MDLFICDTVAPPVEFDNYPQYQAIAAQTEINTDNNIYYVLQTAAEDPTLPDQQIQDSIPELTSEPVELEEQEQEADEPMNATSISSVPASVHKPQIAFHLSAQELKWINNRQKGLFETQSNTRGSDLALRQELVKSISTADTAHMAANSRLCVRFSKIRGKAKKQEAAYACTWNGEFRIVSKEEYQKLFPNKKWLPTAILLTTTSLVTFKLRKRFSKRYREYLSLSSMRTRANRCFRRGQRAEPYSGKEAKPFRLNGAIEALIDIYYDSVYLKGDQALPVPVEETDDEDTDEEFVHRYLNYPTPGEQVIRAADDPALAQVLRLESEQLLQAEQERKAARIERRKRMLALAHKRNYEKNREICKEKQRIYYRERQCTPERREISNHRNREYYSKNREQIRERERERYRRNKEGGTQRMRTKKKRTQKRKSAPRVTDAAPKASSMADLEVPPFVHQQTRSYCFRTDKGDGGPPPSESIEDGSSTD